MALVWLWLDGLAESRGAEVAATAMAEQQSQPALPPDNGSDPRAAGDPPPSRTDVVPPAASPSDPEAPGPRLPSENALRNIRGAMEIEIRSMGERVLAAEAKAGESVADFAVFLLCKLDHQFRIEARESLAAGEVALVREASSEAVYTRPYLRYSTMDLIDGQPAVVCVPALPTERSQVPALRAAWIEAKDSVLESFVAAHNMKSAADRKESRAAITSRTGTGLPKDLEPYLLYRIEFLDGDFARSR